MLSKLFIGAAVLSLAASMAFGAQGAKFYIGEGNKEKVYMDMINKEINTIGFVLSDPHERINDSYKIKWGTEFKTEKGDQVKNPDFDPTFKATLDNLGFFSITNDSVIGPLLMKEPTLGGFSPFNLGIYIKNGDDKTYVGHIMPEAMLDIVGVKDADVRAQFITSFVLLDKMIEQKVGNNVQILDYTALPTKPMMTFEVSFAHETNLDKFKNDFQNKFESTFEAHKYIIAGYKDIKASMNDNNIEFGRYDEYWVYSLCHLQFSEGIFNKGRPDAGTFAPCSMYMYVEKGSHKLIIGMPHMENWIAVMGITDPKMVISIHNLDKEITDIMINLGAKEL